MSVRSVNLVEELKLNFQSERLLLILDEAIERVAPQVIEALAIKDKRRVWICRGGEAAKTLSEYEKCAEQFLSLGIHRKDHLLVIGGGATSDFGGFVAATLLRSISWSVAPTTLLAMIDASIGGKTALNSKAGKNLIGAFHLPQEVLIDSTFLKSLEPMQYQSGLGELMKYAYLDQQIHALVEKSADLQEIIFKCAAYKEGVVQRDLKETGERKFLNFGHTLGHALEKVYQISHGEAVFWGIYLILELYRPSEIPSFKQKAKLLGISFTTPPWAKEQFDVDKIYNYLDKDKKKVSATEVELVLVDEIGKPYCKRHQLSEIKNKIIEKKDVIEKFHL